jgi:hypothetical protein
MVYHSLLYDANELYRRLERVNKGFVKATIDIRRINGVLIYQNNGQKSAQVRRSWTYMMQCLNEVGPMEVNTGFHDKQANTEAMQYGVRVYVRFHTQRASFGRRDHRFG